MEHPHEIGLPNRLREIVLEGGPNVEGLNPASFKVSVVDRRFVSQTRQKGFPNIQRTDVLICYCLLASRRSDRAKRLEQKNKLQCSVVNSGGPL